MTSLIRFKILTAHWRRFGSLKTMIWLGCKLVNRVVTFQILRLKGLLILDENDGIPLDSSYDWRFLSPAEIRLFALDPKIDIDEAFAIRLEKGDICFATFSDNKLISYRGYAFNPVDPDHSFGLLIM